MHVVSTGDQTRRTIRVNTDPGPWTVPALHRLLAQFEAELREAGLEDNTVRTYVDRSRYFVRWLGGDYRPGER